MRVMRWLIGAGWRMTEEREHERRARLLREFEQRRAARRASDPPILVETVTVATMLVAAPTVTLRVPDVTRAPTIKVG